MYLYVSISLSVCRSACLPACLPVCLSVCLSVCACVCPSVCLCPSIHQSIGLSIHAGVPDFSTNKSKPTPEEAESRTLCPIDAVSGRAGRGAPESMLVSGRGLSRAVCRPERLPTALKGCNWATTRFPERNLVSIHDINMALLSLLLRVIHTATVWRESCLARWRRDGPNRSI